MAQPYICTLCALPLVRRVTDDHGIYFIYSHEARSSNLCLALLEVLHYAAFDALIGGLL